ncbi:MAG: class I SAM-dependent methyltransferase [Actinomyces sp.]|uniref:class I SAM-dependent methyltransferase n=1 Tax=Actinomyces sp. TaxID=29317 RepID=UPI0026DD7AF0|nr:class I SAM-dependent methyltransferase [Actinomyces sp.]MDO4242500.1 class I SAM-dependent methyltransferase [Actinomyces sp.]
MDDSTLAPLLTPEGWALLGSLPPYDDLDPLAVGQALREQGHSPGLVAAALTQQRLRGRAEAKFGPFAARMLFTPDGLEQATRLSVAAHHASRYTRAGVTRVADLGCGIGGDSMALAGLGLSVLAVEHDETTAALATVNLMAFPDAEVRCADALEIDLAAEGVDGVFADPARRSRGRRLTDPEQWSPPLSRVLALREQVEALGVKVSPGLAHDLLPADCHAQWVSVEGQVVEAGLWFGPLAHEGPGRSALALRRGQDDSWHAHVLADTECADPSTAPAQAEPIGGAEELGEFVHEPDGAAIRAGLVAHLAHALEAAPVGERIAYLTGDLAPTQALAPFVRSWRLREVLPLHLKALKARVREKDIGRLEIHKRGVDLPPEALRASLHLRGEGSETWLLTRLGPREGASSGGRGAVLVVEPREQAPTG